MFIVQPTQSSPTLNWHELTKSDFVIPCLNFKPWNERKREYSEKLMSGRHRLESMCANYVEFKLFFPATNFVLSFSIVQIISQLIYWSRVCTFVPFNLFNEIVINKISSLILSKRTRKFIESFICFHSKHIPIHFHFRLFMLSYASARYLLINEDERIENFVN